MKKLKLNKETIALLNNTNMKYLVGGEEAELGQTKNLFCKIKTKTGNKNCYKGTDNPNICAGPSIQATCYQLSCFDNEFCGNG